MFFFDPKPVFAGKQSLKVAVLFSENAGSARFVLSQAQQNPALGKKISIVGAVCDNSQAKGTRFFETQNIEVSVIDWQKFLILHQAGRAQKEPRLGFFERVLQDLREMKPDFIMLSGFRRIIPEPLLCEFENRILNVHPADLTITREDKPVFVDKNPVFDAIFEGQTEIRSTIHFVTRDLDCGPVLVLSKPLPADAEKVKELKNDRAKLQEYADFLQEKLKREGDDPAFLKALELVADGLVGIKGSKVFIKENGKWKQGYYDLETGAVGGKEGTGQNHAPGQLQTRLSP